MNAAPIKLNDELKDAANAAFDRSCRLFSNTMMVLWGIGLIGFVGLYHLTSLNFGMSLGLCLLDLGLIVVLGAAGFLAEVARLVDCALYIKSALIRMTVHAAPVIAVISYVIYVMQNFPHC
ncbi:MAG: hypothetical protein GC162_01645 [Planctomycetes bacterium]|nr:hypothetical protein [Planctomycetota bacterium]